MRFVFQHGGGFSSSCWNGWLDLLDAPAILGNRGYWDTSVLLNNSDIQPDSILICHSLGIHLVPQDLIHMADMVVIISGFAHFHGDTVADGRFTKRHVQRMLSRLATEPEQLIRDFHRDCEFTESLIHVKTINTALLTSDLQVLNESRLEKSYCQRWPPTLLIHGRDDRIISPLRAEELAVLPKKSQLRIIDGAGHGLPFNQPSLCLNLIVDFYRHITHSGE
ncbi:MAG: alpha/beta hydrolase [Desulfobulbaceae bacterium]|nr:alpha/beta hydrolase [Desulfobulbaceae bacterium]